MTPPRQPAGECYYERVDGMFLLRRQLPSGRVISIEVDGNTFYVHLNMNNSDNRPENIKVVTEEREAIALLEGFDQE